MKKWMVCASLALLLTGCGAEETFETVADEVLVPAMAQPRQIQVALPGETALPAMESDEGRMYLCQDYEIYLQTLSGGDLEETVRSLSGCDPEDLTVMTTQEEDLTRHEFVWTAMGEGGEQLGRAVVLDDGSYHYAMTVLRDADTTETGQIAWNDVFGSFTVG